MWIDNRTGDIKVYETQPSDPYIKNMTWVPREGAWVLFNPGPSPERFREFIEKGRAAHDASLSTMDRGVAFRGGGKCGTGGHRCQPEGR